jgi:hypothetical protein
VVLSFIALAVGLGFASITANPIVKMAAICIASWGLWSIPPVFYTLPTAFLSTDDVRYGGDESGLDVRQAEILHDLGQEEVEAPLRRERKKPEDAKRQDPRVQRRIVAEPSVCSRLRSRSRP